MKSIIYFHSKRKKRAKKKLKRGPLNLVQYHQFPFLYDETEDEEFMDLDEESSYFCHSGPKKSMELSHPLEFSQKTIDLLKKRAGFKLPAYKFN
ncbi:MAG: hypothetical protein AB8G05_26345 [Oligoflexales bacterium]